MIFTSLLILIVAIAIPLTKQNISYILFSRILTIVFIYTGALTLNALYIQSIGSGIGIYSGLFHVTSITQLLEIFILLTASLILIPSSTYSFTDRSPGQPLHEAVGDEAHLKRVKEYSIVVLFSTLGSILLLSCSDLISMYLSIELQSFGLYILSSLYRESTSATSAGLKYFLLGGLSSCIILLGSGLIYSYTGLTNFESLYSIVSTISSLPSLP
jgi:NADH-ubiquinone oxidoreductase chain 2